ncbi:hypothetical protein DXG01_003522, partial [Tephrocybe rancida]
MDPAYTVNMCAYTMLRQRRITNDAFVQDMPSFLSLMETIIVQSAIQLSMLYSTAAAPELLKKFWWGMLEAGADALQSLPVNWFQIPAVARQLANSLFSGISRPDGRQLWVDFGRLLPPYLHRISRVPCLDTVTPQDINATLGAYLPPSKLWTGHEDYPNITSLAIDSITHIYLQLMMHARYWNMVMTRIEQELPHVLLYLTYGLSPDLWAELVACQFLFSTIPAILRLERSAFEAVGPFFPFVEQTIVLPAMKKTYELGTLLVPSTVFFARIIAVKSKHIRQMLVDCLACLQDASSSLLLCTMANLQQWREFLQVDPIIFIGNLPHVLGGALLCDVVQRVGLIGAFGILDRLLTICSFSGQRFSPLPRTFLISIISLTIAAADLLYNQKRMAEEIMSFDVDLRSPLLESDRIAKEIVESLYQEADASIQGLHTIKYIVDQWLSLPLQGTSIYPWIWLQVPVVHRPVGQTTEEANLFFYHSILHQAAHDAACQNEPISQHVSPTSNMLTHPAYLTHFELIFGSNEIYAALNPTMYCNEVKFAVQVWLTGSNRYKDVIHGPMLLHQLRIQFSMSKDDLMNSLNAILAARKMKAQSELAIVGSAGASSSVGASSSAGVGSNYAEDEPMSATPLNEEQVESAVSDYIAGHSIAPPPAKRRRSEHTTDLPARFRDPNFILNDPNLVDFLPVPLAPAHNDSSNKMQTTMTNDTLPPIINSILDTRINTFGIFRRYTRADASRPLEQHDPESNMTLASLSDIAPAQPTDTQIYYPFPNKSSFLLSDWFWNQGVQKSKDNFKHLLRIIGSADFIPSDVSDTNWNQIDRQLGVNDWDKGEWHSEDAGWQESPVHISIPFHRNTDSPGARPYEVPGFYHCSLVSVIREKITQKKKDAAHFHLELYELLWCANSSREPIPLYGELYSSPAFLRAHQELQQSPAEPGCDLPRVVVALMFWSDATHLTQFGTAKITPLYLYFGNESKYRRCMPSCKLAEHVAFFQQLPDGFKDFVTLHTGEKKVTSELMAHCKRELVHEQWKMLLDEEFTTAYEHGIVLEWVGDGQKRRFYPRLMTYSADYPEKVLMATIRQLGGCPCPRCTLPKAEIQFMGTPEDRAAWVELQRWDSTARQTKITKARRMIYGEQNFAVDSAGVERELKPESLVPTVNAFSDRLEKYGFHWLSMFMVDLLHEIELRVWKALLVHLLRILESVNDNILHELDQRFRLVPTFGRDTIQCFSRNASELKKMAARDYEDLLQACTTTHNTFCFIPVFDGLLPDDEPKCLNSRIIYLLFHLAHWHGLAKLRLHSKITLALLDKSTTILGDALCEFKSDICLAFATRELRREAAARVRREASKAAQTANQDSAATDTIPNQPSIAEFAQHASSITTPPAPQVGTTLLAQATMTPAANPIPCHRRKAKEFSLSTYKLHAMGDYVSTIETFGTTDSYSTETGKLEHKIPKANYKRTSKKVFERQLASIDRKQSRLQMLGKMTSLGTRGMPMPMVDTSESVTDSAVHYHIGVSEHLKQDIRMFINDNQGDPATA